MAAGAALTVAGLLPFAVIRGAVRVQERALPMGLVHGSYEELTTLAETRLAQNSFDYLNIA